MKLSFAEIRKKEKAKAKAEKGFPPPSMSPSVTDRRNSITAASKQLAEAVREVRNAMDTKKGNFDEYVKRFWG